MYVDTTDILRMNPQRSKQGEGEKRGKFSFFGINLLESDLPEESVSMEAA